MQNSPKASSRDQTTQDGVNEVRDWVPGEFSLRDAWFPIAHSPHVSERPIRRTIHSQPYFLWRERGLPVAAEFHPHQLAKLRATAGEFTGGSAYYPVLERYGYVWVWYGDPANASEELVPDVPYLPREGKKVSPNKWGQFFFNCSYELASENLLDLVHADYVHADIIGTEENEGDYVSVESTSETVTMIREVTAKKIPPALRKLGVPSDKADYRGVAHVHIRSGVIVLHGSFTPGFSQPLFHPLIPESRHIARNNYTFNISDAPFVARNVFPLMSYSIGPQDDSMMRPQNPLYYKHDERRDRNSRFDTAGGRYRMLMGKLIARQKGGDYSYAGDADPAKDISGVLGSVRLN